LATSGESRRYRPTYMSLPSPVLRVGAFGYTSRESKAHFDLPWVRPWDNRGKCAWMERGFNAGQTHRSMYPSIFNRLRATTARYRSEIATFFYIPLHLTPHWGYSHWNSGKKFGSHKTRSLESRGYQAVKTV